MSPYNSRLVSEFSGYPWYPLFFIRRIPLLGAPASLFIKMLLLSSVNLHQTGNISLLGLSRSNVVPNRGL